MHWITARRTIDVSRPLVMGILNVTPDSFSDGGKFAGVEDAIRRAEQMIADGADIIDVGGESTRPGSRPVEVLEEGNRTLPVIAAITKRFDTPVSIDTTKWEVARAAVEYGGAEIINDISGLRWDVRMADVAARNGAALILMHSRGEFETMHSQPPIDDILSEVASVLTEAIVKAEKWGVSENSIAIDIGLGFGKTYRQNLELLSNLGRLVNEFAAYPMLVGASRKSFIGKLLDDAPLSERLGGSIAAAISAIESGARIVRVHDVKETAAAVRVLEAIKEAGKVNGS